MISANYLLDIFLHLDRYLGTLIMQYGAWVYTFLFLTIFAETGLVILPFLPGDSLLFVAGTFASLKALNIFFLISIMSLAAILGDSLNYALGSYFGKKVFVKKNSFLFNKEYLAITRKFYEKHGGKTIIIARFIPIIRTFAPFVAGIGKMNYGKFLSFNLIGGIIWVALFSLAGFFFGNIPLVKNNFSLVIIAIIMISLLPIIIKGLQKYRKY